MAKPDTVVNKIRKALEKYPAVEVSGGPVEVSLDLLDTIWLLGYFGNPAMRAALQRDKKSPRLCTLSPAIPASSTASANLPRPPMPRRRAT